MISQTRPSHPQSVPPEAALADHHSPKTALRSTTDTSPPVNPPLAAMPEREVTSASETTVHNTVGIETRPVRPGSTKPLNPPKSNDQPRPSKFRHLLTLSVWAVILIGGYFAYPYALPWIQSLQPQKAEKRGGPPRAVPVVTAAARRGDMDLYLTGLGTATAFNTVTVRSRVDGELIRVLFNEGQMVEQGQLLAQIDPRQFEVRLDEAEGTLAKDQATLKNAQLDLDRYRDLAATRSVSQQQIDLQLSTVRQLTAVVETDLAIIENAKLQLSYCEITAPIGGRIGLRSVDGGNLVRANDPGGLAVITQLQPIAVVFTIPQDQISQVQRRITTGQELVVDAFDRDLRNRLATGKLSALDNQVDATTGTIKLKAVFPNEDSMLFPNQFVNARLLVDTRRDAVIVPAAAVQRGPSSTFVYIVKADETVELRNVELAQTEGDDIVIESGLSPGDLVVTDGVDKLQPGAKVALSNPASKAGATANAKQLADKNVGGDTK